MLQIIRHAALVAHVATGTAVQIRDLKRLFGQIILLPLTTKILRAIFHPMLPILKGSTYFNVCSKAMVWHPWPN